MTNPEFWNCKMFEQSRLMFVKLYAKPPHKNGQKQFAKKSRSPKSSLFYKRDLLYGKAYCSSIMEKTVAIRSTVCQGTSCQ